MSQKLKVVTIGGGSSYTPELLEGFLKRYHELPVSELWLVDVEEGQEKLDIIHALCQRMVEKAGVPMKVYKTLDRRAALQGADFVTTQLRVGQLKAREKDERIPLSHGYLGQETNGAGGLFKGLRTIPVIFDIVKDVQEICPDAWIINFTNPAGMVTEAVYRLLRGKSFDITGKRRNLTGIRGITGFTLFGYLIPVKEKLSRSAKLLILLLKSLHWSKGGVQNQFYHTSK